MDEYQLLVQMADKAHLASLFISIFLIVAIYSISNEIYLATAIVWLITLLGMGYLV